MTLKEKIQHLISIGYTQIQIEQETGIEQSSVSRILNNAQKSVQYEKGQALDSLIVKAQEIATT